MDSEPGANALKSWLEGNSQDYTAIGQDQGAALQVEIPLWAGTGTAQDPAQASF